MFNEQNDYYIVKGWFEESGGIHNGTFYGAMATPDNPFRIERATVPGDNASLASQQALSQTSRVYPSEIFKEEKDKKRKEEDDDDGLTKKEKKDSKHLLLDEPEEIDEMVGTGAIAPMPTALQSSTNTDCLGMPDRGGHGHIDNLGSKKVKAGRNIKGNVKKRKSNKSLKGFGTKFNMNTISQSGGKRGGKEI